MYVRELILILVEVVATFLHQKGTIGMDTKMDTEFVSSKMNGMKPEDG